MEEERNCEEGATLATRMFRPWNDTSVIHVKCLEKIGKCFRKLSISSSSSQLPFLLLIIIITIIIIVINIAIFFVVPSAFLGR
jgi:hypothetical protein